MGEKITKLNPLVSSNVRPRETSTFAEGFNFQNAQMVSTKWCNSFSGFQSTFNFSYWEDFFNGVHNVLLRILADKGVLGLFLLCCSIYLENRAQKTRLGPVLHLVQLQDQPVVRIAGSSSNLVVQGLLMCSNGFYSFTLCPIVMNQVLKIETPEPLCLRSR
jgi:hypothetical protein